MRQTSQAMQKLKKIEKEKRTAKEDFKTKKGTRRKLFRISTKQDFRLSHMPISGIMAESSERESLENSGDNISLTSSVNDKRMGVKITDEEELDHLRDGIVEVKMESREESEDEMTKSEIEMNQVTGLNLRKYLISTDIIEI